MNNKVLPRIAITSGEPAGVGPELCWRLNEWVHKNPDQAELVVLVDQTLLAERAQALSALGLAQSQKAHLENKLEVLHIPLLKPSTPGYLDVANATYVLALLDRAMAGCCSGEFAAMVTAPVHKGVINEAGIAFTGHTEYLAEKTHAPHVVMMLADEKGLLRVALATTHLPLKDVPAAITQDSLEKTLRVLHAEMRQKYALKTPRILVAGLNPHAGEGGYLGREEIEIITPVLERLRAEGMHLIGPLPADTLFTPPILAQGDCVLAMYHDQGLTALKYASFGKGVNVTLGLPFIRTSVDHGTALELAPFDAHKPKNRADPGSLFVALEQALEMVARQKV